MYERSWIYAKNDGFDTKSHGLWTQNHGSYSPNTAVSVDSNALQSPPATASTPPLLAWNPPFLAWNPPFLGRFWGPKFPESGFWSWIRLYFFMQDACDLTLDDWGHPAADPAPVSMNIHHFHHEHSPFSPWNTSIFSLKYHHFSMKIYHF